MSSRATAPTGPLGPRPWSAARVVRRLGVALFIGLALMWASSHAGASEPAPAPGQPGRTVDGQLRQVRDAVAPVVAPVLEPVEPVVQRVSQLPGRALSGTQPAAAPVLQPVVDQVVQPVLDQVVQPVVDQVVLPVLTPVVDDVVSPVTAPVVHRPDAGRPAGAAVPPSVVPDTLDAETDSPVPPSSGPLAAHDDGRTHAPTEVRRALVDDGPAGTVADGSPTTDRPPADPVVPARQRSTTDAMATPAAPGAGADRSPSLGVVPPGACADSDHGERLLAGDSTSESQPSPRPLVAPD